MQPIQIPEEKIREMAEKYAIDGAEKAIREYYTGYDSPFMKEVRRQIDERLQTNIFFELPTLTAAINQAINQKITAMASEVVAQTFLPMLNRMFTQERRAVVTTQDLYTHFGDAMKEDKDDDFDAERMELKIERSSYGSDDRHLYLLFNYDDQTQYRLSLMWGHGDEKDPEGQPLYMLTSLPGCSQYSADHYPRERQMRIRMADGAQLEMPFTPDILRDEFMRYIAGLLLCNTKVVVKQYHDYYNDEEY